jgi:hypothetical protein
LLIWGFGCWYYDKRSADFVPSNPLVWDSEELRQLCAGTPQPPSPNAHIGWDRCQQDMPREFNPFRPWLYSLDQMIPVVQLGQKRDWDPIRHEYQTSYPDLWFVIWTEIILSGALYIWIGASLGGLIKRD